jgi:cell division transport system permease protein
MSGPVANARAGDLGRRVELHRAAFSQALQGFASRPVASALTLVVLALALALPLFVAMGVRNLEGLGAGLKAARDLNVYLVPGLDADAVAAARARVESLPGVGGVTIRTPDEGLARLAELPGASDVLAGLEDNPLPHVLVVRPEASLDPPALRALAAQLEALPGVDLVNHDLAWRDRFEALLAAARRLLLILAAITGAGAMLVVAQTIWAEIARRREEIAIIQSLGGSRAYIRRPFLYAGTMLGLGAAIGALALVGISWLLLAEPVAALAASYDSEATLRGPSWAALAITGLVGPMLGWSGAFLATTRELARGDRR